MTAHPRPCQTSVKLPRAAINALIGAACYAA
jgi:hypothetical protein